MRDPVDVIESSAGRALLIVGVASAVAATLHAQGLLTLPVVLLGSICGGASIVGALGAAICGWKRSHDA